VGSQLQPAQAGSLFSSWSDEHPAVTTATKETIIPTLDNFMVLLSVTLFAIGQQLEK
jgi:hypothetical protein